jgi:hypothetical protein
VIEMRKLLTKMVAVSLLMFGANAAHAIPLDIEVGTAGLGSTGSWLLTGPTFSSGSWTHTFPGAVSTWNRDIGQGDYVWRIGGAGLFAGVGWRLTLDGSTIYGNGAAGIKFSFRDRVRFTAVPEPATLGLLGMALCAAGFAARRRTSS